MQIVQYDIFHCVIAGLEHGVQIVGAVQLQFFHKSFPIEAHLDTQQLLVCQFVRAAAILLQLIDLVLGLEGNRAAPHRKAMSVYFRGFPRIEPKVPGQFGLFKQADQLGKVGILTEPSTFEFVF